MNMNKNKKILLIIAICLIIIPINVYAKSNDIVFTLYSNGGTWSDGTSGSKTATCTVNNECSFPSITNGTKKILGWSRNLGKDNCTYFILGGEQKYIFSQRNFCDGHGLKIYLECALLACWGDATSAVAKTNLTDATGVESTSSNTTGSDANSKTTTKAPYTPVGENFCSDIKDTTRFLGYIIMALKFLIPFMIILVGSFDYAKAITSKDDDTIKKQTVLFGKRILAGLIFFFLPAILEATMTLVSGWSSVAAEYNECTTCLFSPNKCK